jgi:hypothetical protein
MNCSLVGTRNADLFSAFNLVVVPHDQPWSRLAAVWLTAVAPAGFTVSLSVATSNTMGSTKKTFTNASVFLGFAIGSKLKFFSA